MAQVNFNIPDELKEAYDKALEESSAENKPEFFEQMLSAFTLHQNSKVDTDIDLSKYESVNTQTKEAMSNAFKHIFSLLDGNLSTAKAEAIYVDTEKKALADKEEDFKEQLEKLTANSNAEILNIKAEYKETIEDTISQMEVWKEKSLDFEIKNKELIQEFENISKVADQVEFISNENKELREKFTALEEDHQKTISSLELKNNSLDAELVEVKQSLFVASIEKATKEKELNTFIDQAKKEAEVFSAAHKKNEDKLVQVTKELEEVKSEYNQALGKLEILEKVESK